MKVKIDNRWRRLTRRHPLTLALVITPTMQWTIVQWLRTGQLWYNRHADLRRIHARARNAPIWRQLGDYVCPVTPSSATESGTNWWSGYDHGTWRPSHAIQRNLKHRWSRRIFVGRNVCLDVLLKSKTPIRGCDIWTRSEALRRIGSGSLDG